MDAYTQSVLGVQQEVEFGGLILQMPDLLILQNRTILRISKELPALTTRNPINTLLEGGCHYHLFSLKAPFCH